MISTRREADEVEHRQSVTERMRQLRSEAEKRGHNEEIDMTSELGKEIMDSAMQCPRCFKRTLKYYTRQTRSADEGETTFVRCRNDKCNYFSRS